MLINALASMGLIQAPEFIKDLPDALKEGKEAVKDFISKGAGKLFKDVDLDADIKKMDAATLEARKGRLEALRQNFEEGSKEFQYLTDEIRNTDIQLSIKTKLEGDDAKTIEQLRQMSDEDLAKEFNIDLNDDEFDIKIAEIRGQLDEMADYDMAIHVDDTQFAELIEAITGEPYEAKVHVETDAEEEKD